MEDVPPARERWHERAVEHVRRGFRAVRRYAAGARGISVAVWVILLIVCGAIFLTRERGDLHRLGHVLRTASIGWLLLAFATELAVLSLMALQQQIVYRSLGQRLPYRVLWSLLLRRMMIATIVPGGAPLSVAMQVKRLSDRGVPTSVALFGELFSGSIGTVSFVSVLIPVAIGLVVEGSANTATLAATIILSIACTAILTLFALALRPSGPPRMIYRPLPAKLREGLDHARGEGVSLRGVLPAFVVALGVDFGGVAVLYLSIRAIHDHLSLMDSLVGYAVGSAFIFITPVFGGFGVVELSMATALTARGLPVSSALAGVLVYRSFELWLPILLGIANEPLVQRGSSVLAGVGLRRLPTRLPALAAGATGALALWWQLRPHPLPESHGGFPHEPFSPTSGWVLSFPQIIHSAALVSGVLLVALAWGLWRRKRLAWLVSLGALVVAEFDDVFRHHGTPFLLIALMTTALLIYRRHDFRVRTDIPTVGGAIVGVVCSVLFALAYGTVGFWMLDRRDFGQMFDVRESLEATLGLYVGLGQSDLHPMTRHAYWFRNSLTIVGIMSILIAAFSIWRPIVWRNISHPAELRRARAFIARYGDSSLDTFKGWDDKHFFFNDAGDGLVAFSLSSGCALALGDPVVSNDSAVERTIEEYVDWCDSNGWTCAFHQATPERAAAYRRAGLTLLKIGEEAVVDLTTFSLDGRSMKAMRSALRRLEREGYRTVTHCRPHSPELVARLKAVSDAWLGLDGRRERGFTLGQWSEGYIQQCDVVSLEAADGAIVAFANLIGDGAPGEATVDMMRRRGDSPNAAMDALFISIFEMAKRQGKTAFSLGMVPWVALGEEPTAPPVERAIRRLNTAMERFFSISGLYHFKEKFVPRWRPRYLAYVSDLDLARVTVALIRITEREPVVGDGWNGITTPEAGTERSASRWRAY